MREKSGGIVDNRPLVTFLYKLMRDEVTPGRIEEILLEAGIDEPVTTPHDVVFTNGWLAQYAQDLAWRLTGWDSRWPVDSDQHLGDVIMFPADRGTVEFEDGPG